MVYIHFLLHCNFHPPLDSDILITELSFIGLMVSVCASKPLCLERVWLDYLDL